jgi:hypothetical protein
MSLLVLLVLLVVFLLCCSLGVCVVLLLLVRYYIPQDEDRAQRMNDTGRGQSRGDAVSAAALRAYDSGSDGGGDSSDDSEGGDAGLCGGVHTAYSNSNHRQHLFQPDNFYRNTAHFVCVRTSGLDRVFVRGGAGSGGVSSTGARSHHSAQAQFLVYSERKLVSFVPGSSNIKPASPAPGDMAISATGVSAPASGAQQQQNPQSARKQEEAISKPYIVDTSEVRQLLPLVLLCGGDFHVLRQSVYAAEHRRRLKDQQCQELGATRAVAAATAAGAARPWEDDMSDLPSLSAAPEVRFAETACVDVTAVLLAPLLGQQLPGLGHGPGVESAISRALLQFDPTPAGKPVSLPSAAGGGGAGASVGEGTQIPPGQRVLIVIDNFCVFSTDVHTATLLLYARLLLQVILLASTTGTCTGVGFGGFEGLQTVIDRVIELMLLES